MNSFVILSKFLDEWPERVIQIRKEDTPPIVIASDAQADSSPSGGYLLWDPVSNKRIGRCVMFPEDMLRLWGYDIAAGGNPIASCEATMPALVSVEHAPLLRNRSV